MVRRSSGESRCVGVSICTGVRIRNSPHLGPYGRAMPRAIRWSGESRCVGVSTCSVQEVYGSGGANPGKDRSTSLIRNSHHLGPCRRAMPRALRWSGGVPVSRGAWGCPPAQEYLAQKRKSPPRIPHYKKQPQGSVCFRRSQSRCEGVSTYHAPSGLNPNTFECVSCFRTIQFTQWDETSCPTPRLHNLGD